MEEQDNITSVSSVIMETNLTLNTSTDSKIIYNTFTATAYNVAAAYLFIISCLGIPLNIIILVLYTKDRYLRTPNNYLFVSLALGDLLVAVFGSAFKFVITIRRTLLKQGDAFCKWYGFITYLGGLAALMTLSMIALIRCLSILRPGNFTGLTSRMGAVILAFIWTYSLGFTVAPLIGWNRYTPEGLATWCSIDWLSDDPTAKSFVYAIFLFCFLVPVTIIIISYSLVYNKVREVAKTGGSVAKAEKEVLKMTLMMVSFFLLAWCPYAIVCMLASFGPQDTLHPIATVVPAMFAKSSTIYNPMIYVFMNAQFRKSLKGMLGVDTTTATDGSERVTIAANNQVAPEAAVTR